MSRNRKGINALVTAVILCAAAFLADASLGASARNADWYRARQESGGSPAVAQMAGQFRVVGANLLWVKVEAYHEEWEARGLDWTKNADLYPLLNAIVYLDPHFTQAYAVHATMLVYNNHEDQAIALLQQGIDNNPNNPDAFDLYKGIGLIYAVNRKQPEKGLPYLVRAFQVAEDPFDKQNLGRSVQILTRRLQAEKAKTKPAQN